MTLIIAALLAPFILLTFCFGLEVFTGLRPLPEIPIDDQRASAVVIVPAHNEGAILADRLARLKDAVGESARILVVADNCSDSTADIARSLAVEVIERNDDERRGKGFALDFAKRSLLSAPPAVVLIVDADCMIDGDSITRLINRCVATQSPCQATNLQAPALQASPAVQLSTFAFFIKNVIRQRALQRLAGRVHLLGTGMALPWSIFERSDLATSSIVEDLKLGQELAQAGHAPKFIEDATIWSNAETERNTLSQRSRWEGGFLQNGLSAGPKYLLGSILRADLRGAWAAINLMIPPFALLLLLDLIALLLGFSMSWFIGARLWPALLLTAVIAVAFIALALAWHAGGSRFVTLAGLARVPFYLIWKLPLYLGFARSGTPKEWLRTGRGDL